MSNEEEEDGESANGLSTDDDGVSTQYSQNVFDWNEEDAWNSAYVTKKLICSDENDNVDDVVDKFIQTSIYHNQEASKDIFGMNGNDMSDTEVHINTEEKMTSILSCKTNNNQIISNLSTVSLETADVIPQNIYDSSEKKHVFNIKQIADIEPVKKMRDFFHKTSHSISQVNLNKEFTHSQENKEINSNHTYFGTLGYGKNSRFKLVLDGDDAYTTTNRNAAVMGVLTTDPSKIVRLIIEKKPHYLDEFKSPEQKASLLSAAIESNSTSCICRVLLFLKSTLTNEHFLKMVKKYPRAGHEYMYYLKQTGNMDEYNKFCKMTCSRTYIIQAFKSSLSLPPDKLIKALEKLRKKYQNIMGVQDILEYVIKQENLVRKQISIIEAQAVLLLNDKKNKDEKTVPFRVISGDSSFTTALFAIHQQISTSNIPAGLQQEFNLSDIQFEWLLVKSYVARKYFDQLKNIFIQSSKAFVFKSFQKPTSHMGFDLIAQYLHEHDVPSNIVEEFINFIVDTDTRICVAEKCKNYDVIIKACVKLNDKEMLLEKTRTIKDENFKMKAEEAIKTMKTDWSKRS